MNKEKLLLKNTAIVTIGKICTQLITFFLLPIYTAVLTTEEYGVVDLLNTLVSLFIPIVTLQIEQGIFRFLVDCRGNNEETKKTISTVILLVTTQLMIYLVVFLVASFFIHNPYKYFLVCNLVVAVYSTILLQICRGLGDNTKYAIGSFITGVCTVILNIILIVAFRLGAYGMLIATFLGNFICILYILFSKKIYQWISIPKYDKEKRKQILKFSLPLVPNIISWWVVNTSDRSLITYFLGIGINGIYATAAKFSGVLTTLYTVFNLTWTESASVNIEAEDRDIFFSKILDIVLRIFGTFIIGVIAVLPFVFSILVKNKFRDSYYQIPILLVGSMFSILVSFIGSIYVAKKVTKEVAKTSILAAVINILINVILIKKIGLYAASISTLIAYMTMFIYRAIDTRKYVKLTVKPWLVIHVLVMLGIACTSYYLRNTYLHIIVLLAVVIDAFFTNQKSIKFIKNSLIKN